MSAISSHEAGEEKERPVRLKVTDLSKRFESLTALDSLSFTVAAGEALALLGDNGAGKSTALNILGGLFPPSHGQVFIDDQPVIYSGTAHARRLGVEFVHQDLALCNQLSAAENIFLGRELRGPFFMLKKSEMQQRTVAALADLGARVEPGAPVHRLSGGQRQSVALARVAFARPKICLFDEPTAALGGQQIQRVYDFIRQLKAAGTSVLIVSHRMPDIVACCERAVVLKRGAVRTIIEVKNFTAMTLAEEIYAE